MYKLKQSILTIAIGLALVAGISYAWTGPTANPPGANAPAPLNVLGDSGGGTQTIADTKTLFMGDGTKTLGIVGSIWTNGLVNTEGGLLSKGGTNKDNWQSVFPWWVDGKNYIRGTTIIADNDTDNKVGIGTADPQAKLDVVGSAKITKLGTNGLSPDSGYPSGWTGGIHTFDVYSDGGTIAAGRNGNVNASINADGKIKIADGTQGEGKVLTSDSNGVARWSSNGGGGGGGIWIGHKFVQNGATASCDIDTGFNHGGFLTNFNAKMEDSKMYLRMIRKAFSNKYNQNDFDTGWVNSARIYSNVNDELKAEFGLIIATDIWGNTCSGNWY